jgi:uncharacterized membrane protein YbhN (UPF0104 family)
VSSGGGLELPRELTPRRLARRGLVVVAFLAVVVLVVELAPGLSEVRTLLADASPTWIALGLALEGLSCVSYVLMFRQVFCRQMSWRASWEIGLSELAVGSVVPASGAGALALGAWILHESGMPGEEIGRRSVAFFLVKSSVNFVAVALIGALMAIGIVGPHKTLLLTALPAALSALVIAVILLLPRLGPGERPSPDAGRVRRAIAAMRRALLGGTAEAVALVRSGDPLLIAGALGYWIFDNAVLWAAFHAFGSSPPLSIVLMGYLIGQLGGALPLPGGVGGIDGGLFGTLVAYGTPVADTAAAVLAYRLILFWLPLVVGGVAFLFLRRGLNAPERPDLCWVPPGA